MFYKSWFRSQLCKFVELEGKDKTCKTGVKNTQTEQVGGTSESEHAEAPFVTLCRARSSG